MKYPDFVQATCDLPVIESANLPQYLGREKALQVQISRWVKAGKLLQLRRGIYVLAEPFRKMEIYLPHLASILQAPSYISMEKALEYHDLIPEAVSVFTSLTTKRTARLDTPLGIFDYRHVAISLFWGYQSVSIHKQTAFIAVPEKALLDLLYFHRGQITAQFIEELRLQSLEKLDPNKLMRFAKKMDKAKVVRAAKLLQQHLAGRMKGEKSL